MTKNENLLVTAMEECAEVQQAISKALRFGMGTYNPTDPQKCNQYDILLEYYQLCAVMKMLQINGVLPDMKKEERAAIMVEKMDKVAYYQTVSESIGTIKA